MKIAIEARAMSHPQPGGFKTYTTNLVHGLLSTNQDDDYCLYFDRAIDDLVIAGNEHAKDTIPRHTSSGIGVILREQVHLFRFLQQEKPDVVHFPCGTGALFCRFPLVITLHDVIEFIEPYDLSRISTGMVRRWLMKFYTRLVERWLAKKAACIITDSEYSKADISRLLGVQADKINAIPIAQAAHFQRIENSDFLQAVSKKYQLPDHFLLAMASASPRKNVAGLLQSYSMFPASLRCQYPLVIIWTHELYKETVTRLITPNQLEGDVVFLPRVNDQELVALYNLAAIFIMPSLYEGFGLPVLEAMACGTPVICSNQTSLPEVAGEAAVLVDPQRPEAMAAAIEDLLLNAEKRCALSQAGLKRASQFSWENTARQTYAAYQRAAVQKRGAAV